MATTRIRHVNFGADLTMDSGVINNFLFREQAGSVIPCVKVGADLGRYSGL